jgi:hypothetical protein
VEAGDLLVVIGAPDDYSDPERWALQKALSRAVSQGLAEKRLPGPSGGRSTRCCLYRITAAGRLELARRLAADTRIASDREAAEPGSAAA